MWYFITYGIGFATGAVCILCSEILINKTDKK
jgi:hypothetical protein